VAGRWSLLPSRDPDPTRRGHLTAELLLDRYGLITRGAVASEGTVGGFAQTYRVLSAFEESGRVTRAYVVEGLGAAQFAAPGAIDAVRATTAAHRAPTPALVLAAADPANPYGAALPWPVPRTADDAPKHRPGRKAGAAVVLVDGELVLYVERGGRTLLSWPDDPDVLASAARALADAIGRGSLGRIIVERADGASVMNRDSALGAALEAAGFVLTPRGLRARRA
jgi:ATP-dependent Lhr-like helicase